VGIAHRAAEARAGVVLLAGPGAVRRTLELSGVTMRFGSEVSALEAEGGRVVAVRLGAERIAVDACVVALGSRSPSLLAPLRIAVPVYPVKGYSLTIPVRDETRSAW